jgi:hypothetical protein
MIGYALVATLLVGEANAMPLAKAPALSDPGLVENVKIVCDEAGVCVRPPGRRPVATWVYGDNNFVGPAFVGSYNGPGWYGSPRRRYKWWPFYW